MCRIPGHGTQNLGRFARYTWALSYYSDLALSQAFHPMAAQLSKKAAHPLAKILATTSCCCSKTGPRLGCGPGSRQTSLGLGYHVPVFCTDINLYNKPDPCRVIALRRYGMPLVNGGTDHKTWIKRQRAGSTETRADIGLIGPTLAQSFCLLEGKIYLLFQL